MGIAPIIVGLDQSLAAASVLENALTLCGLLKRPLVTVTTAEPPPGAVDVELELEWRNEVDEYLDRLTKRAPAQTVVARIVSVAPAWSAICDAASAHDSPLVVVGSHTRQTLDFVLSTTATRVANRAHCCVFVCHPWHRIHPSYAKLLIALDTSERGRVLVDSALRLLTSPQSRVVLLRAIVSPERLRPKLLRQTATDLERLLREDAVRQLDEVRHQLAEDVDCEIRVATEEPWVAITQTAEKEDVDLIVIGSHGATLLDRVLGTTTSHVVGRAKRSVLVIKGKGL